MRLFGSTYTRTPSKSKTRSFSRGGSSENSITYEKPEQPPPFSPRRTAASGVPRFASCFFAISTAFGVSEIDAFDGVALSAGEGATDGRGDVSWGSMVGLFALLRLLYLGA